MGTFQTETISVGNRGTLDTKMVSMFYRNGSSQRLKFFQPCKTDTVGWC